MAYATKGQNFSYLVTCGWQVANMLERTLDGYQRLSFGWSHTPQKNTSQDSKITFSQLPVKHAMCKNQNTPFHAPQSVSLSLFYTHTHTTSGMTNRA